MSDELLWWGYVHINGGIQVKRYHDDSDLDDAYESDFVQQVFRPFSAGGRDEAIQTIRKLIKGGDHEQERAKPTVRGVKRAKPTRKISR